MKCLVTGGAGFIGSHLCDWLVAEGNDVICVDNLLTGNKRNITQLLTHPRFRFIQADCSKPLTEVTSADVIYHLASPASPPKYQKYFLETMLVNTYGTYLLLEQARKWKAKFLFASTSEAYGDPLIHPQPETYWGNVNPNGVRSCYDESKRMGEAFVMSYVRNFNMDARIVRLFNTYGPRMDIDDGRVVTNFIKQILRRLPLTVHGKGTQTRSFCYISDMVEGIVKVAQSEVARGEVINLGNTEEKQSLNWLI